jgi:hypothetical protein
MVLQGSAPRHHSQLKHQGLPEAAIEISTQRILGGAVLAVEAAEMIGTRAGQ